MSELKIDGAAVYFLLQCVSDVVRSLDEKPHNGASSKDFVQALRENFALQMNHPDTLSYEEDQLAELLLERFLAFVADGSIRIASLLPD